MAETKIEWCDYTFNHIRGCTKVSPGCKFCYAETLSKRNPAALGNWGPQGVRVVAAESYWRKPVLWNQQAQKVGGRLRVFCASLADVFEGADTMPADSWPVVQAARLRLLRLIYDTPHLDWLLLTKRPENIVPALVAAKEMYWQSLPVVSHYDPSKVDARSADRFYSWLQLWGKYKCAPNNVWLGTSVENQGAADARIPHLLAAPAAVRFLSCEPLLGPIEFSDVTRRSDWKQQLGKPALAGIDWVIVGGESGPKARPMHPAWARRIQQQCAAVGVPFLFKQWGEWAPCPDERWHGLGGDGTPQQAAMCPTSGQLVGGFLTDQLADQRTAEGWLPIQRIGKHAAGRLLDGQEYSEFPLSSPAAL